MLRYGWPIADLSRETSSSAEACLRPLTVMEGLLLGDSTIRRVYVYLTRLFRDMGQMDNFWKPHANFAHLRLKPHQATQSMSNAASARPFKPPEDRAPACQGADVTPQPSTCNPLSNPLLSKRWPADFGGHGVVKVWRNLLPQFEWLCNIVT